MTLLRRLTRPWSIAVLTALIAASTAHADTVNTRERRVRELAPGVYTIRHVDPTDDFPDGNTTVVIGEREVLVVKLAQLWWKNVAVAVTGEKTPQAARDNLLRRWTT